MWFEWKVAVRFLYTGKLQTVLILAGIVIGVAVQVFLGSLIGGLQQDLINQTIGSSPHVMMMAEDALPRAIRVSDNDLGRTVTFTVRDRGLSNWQNIVNSIEGDEEITAISPTITGSGFAIRGQKNQPIVFRGIDLDRADEIYRISPRLVEGEALLGGNNVLLGRELAEELNLRAGDTVQLRTGDGVQDRFRVSGIFNLGNQDLNESWVFLSLPRSATLLNQGSDISTIELQIADVFASNDIAERLKESWPATSVESWQQSNEDLLTALQSQSSSSLVIQFFVIVAVTLGISSVLAVSVVQKSRQIGILKAMGTNRKRVGRIFLIQGFLLGAIGAVLGILTGIGLSQLFVNLVRTPAGDPLFPIEVDPIFIGISFLIATSAGMLAALIPARNSAKLNPIEVIQNG